ncbi:hypothetical protein EJ08DRAFT_647319 [Tothia fuscella]|uniref:Uncharacterized protein n=1 Tax=Tothia fuscella TaxID=1048955 RepID=A0A9P4NWJ0_9PEZI|nr:hypothetical protein EJ08DRAFT_647319 [Tothia fuscella]
MSNISTTYSPEGSKPVYSALRDIQYGSIVDSDDASLSEDDRGDGTAEVAEERVIGFSISRAQTRLASPKTPAMEKAAAMEERGGFFDNKWDFHGGPGGQSVGKEVSATAEDQVILDREQEGAALPKPETPKEEAPRNGTYNEVINTSPPPKLPSPWRAGPKNFQISQRTESSVGILREGFKGSRERSHSGPEGPRMKLPFGLPSLLFASGGKEEPGTLPMKHEEAEKLYCKGIPQADGTIRNIKARVRGFSPEPRRVTESGASLAPTEHRPGQTVDHHVAYTEEFATPTQHPNLRRIRSDESLFLQRALSRASSLGDDTRFENVQESVNSRLKALKDSFQDANFKFALPKAPAFFGTRNDQSLSAARRSSPAFSKSSLYPRIGNSLLEGQFSLPSPKPRGTNPSDFKRAATAGMSAQNAADHPYFVQALENLTGDLVVLGGYRGSVLRETKPPHRRVWVPLKIGLNLRKVDLEVGLEPEDEENMYKTIFPSGMLTHIGPVDMARRLLKRLHASDNVLNGTLRVHEYSYDWRLSPHKLSRDLIRFVRSLPCTQARVSPEQRGALVLAHSLGGLITRFAVNQRPELFSGVVYAGTPQTCVNILGPLRNGDDVLLSSRVLTAQVNFTIRTSFALLPLDGRCFIDKVTKEEYPVDFFNFDDWEEYRWSPCISQPLPPLATPPPGRLGSIIESVSSVLPSTMADILPAKPFGYRRDSQSTKSSPAKDVRKEKLTELSKKGLKHAEGGEPNSGVAVQMGGNQCNNPAEYGESTNTNVATAVTIPRAKAVEYLKRTLAEVKDFKENLAFIPSHAENNLYPPAAVIYGKSEPTVYGARVSGRVGIKRADAYDDLAFASGDGVVLARAAMLPEGYKAVRGGVVASDRGHITLLGDLEAVGRCLSAVISARKLGLGMGIQG